MGSFSDLQRLYLPDSGCVLLQLSVHLINNTIIHADNDYLLKSKNNIINFVGTDQKRRKLFGLEYGHIADYNFFGVEFESKHDHDHVQLTFIDPIQQQLKPKHRLNHRLTQSDFVKHEFN
ncbi:hypothetical protein UCDDA912_g04738 [Diaporthe ampelina]|uniref:Uncharacterized protein n=1 Tax=Diaporthe ampelina TaxID=1214573 RepID=A0A0G2HJV6_9PEZI|nr:hypothetical protein UCDDA912_g04738 [Diaporthe ampelina]